MSRLTPNHVVDLMEAYNAVYAPQVNEDYLWESYLTEEFISEAYQTVADYLVYNGFVPGYNTAEVYMSEMAVEDIDSILFETGVLDEQYLIEAGFFQGIGAGADRFVSGAQKKVQGAVAGAQRAGQTAVGTVKRAGNAVVGGAQRLGTAATGAAQGAVRGATALGQTAVGGVQRAAGTVQRAVTPVAQAVQGTAQRAVSAGQSALGGASRAVQGAGQAVVGGAQRLGTAAVGAVKADIGNKIKMGQAIAGGVQRSVNAVGSVANSATRAVGSAVNAAGRRIGQEVEISRKVGAGEPLKPAAAKPTTPAPAARPATPAPAARPATPAPAARPATPAPAAKPATPAPTATTGNPPLRPPALPPITGRPSLASGVNDIKAMQAASRQRQGLTQSFDVFDVIKGHLIDEGYADTEDAAIQIMANMSEEWREEIIDEANRPEREMIKKGLLKSSQVGRVRNLERHSAGVGSAGAWYGQDSRDQPNIQRPGRSFGRTGPNNIKQRRQKDAQQFDAFYTSQRRDEHDKSRGKKTKG